jgi:hypothetical protein
VRSLAGQLAAFTAAVRGGPTPSLGTAADGLAAMEVLETVAVSAARGGRPTAVTRAGVR